jgi:predicted transcriptional regulator
VKSVRLDADLEAQLQEAARALGVSESEFIRRAIAAQSQALLKDRLDQRLAGLVGAVRSRGGRARDAGNRYVELLRRQKARGSKQPS